MKRTVPCPHCGEPIAADAISCRHCGSDRGTGWASEEEISYQSVDIPETWPPEAERRRGVGWAVRMILLLVLLSMLTWLLTAVL